MRATSSSSGAGRRSAWPADCSEHQMALDRKRTLRSQRSSRLSPAAQIDSAACPAGESRVIDRNGVVSTGKTIGCASRRIPAPDQRDLPGRERSAKRPAVLRRENRMFCRPDAGAQARLRSYRFLNYRIIHVICPTRLGKNCGYKAGVARSVTTANHSVMLVRNVCRTSQIARRAEARPLWPARRAFSAIYATKRSKPRMLSTRVKL